MTHRAAAVTRVRSRSAIPAARLRGVDNSGTSGVDVHGTAARLHLLDWIVHRRHRGRETTLAGPTRVSTAARPRAASGIGPAGKRVGRRT